MEKKEEMIVAADEEAGQDNNKSYSVYIKYYSKQGEKIVVLVRILMSKSGFEDEVLIK
jgi:hypothetical protein